MESVSIDMRCLQQQHRMLSGFPQCVSHYLYQDHATAIEQGIERSVLPLARYALQTRYPAVCCDDTPIHLIHIDPSDTLFENSAFVAQVLNALAAPTEAWVPVCSSHTYLLHCLELALMTLDSVSRKRILVYVGDYNNAAAFRLLAQRQDMDFCCQALL